MKLCFCYQHGVCKYLYLYFILTDLPVFLSRVIDIVGFFFYYFGFESDKKKNIKNYIVI